MFFSEFALASPVDRQIRFKVLWKGNLNIGSFEPKDTVQGRTSFTVFGQQSIRILTVLFSGWR